MRPYNYKVWAYEPEAMNKQWIGERVAVLDVDRGAQERDARDGRLRLGPNNQFKFPLRAARASSTGGSGPAQGWQERRRDAVNPGEARVSIDLGAGADVLPTAPRV